MIPRALYASLILINIVIFNVFGVVKTAPLVKREIRLCSTDLSDALSHICSKRGFNEPSANSGDILSRGKRGIVEECCHQPCTYEILEQYCQ